MNSIAETIQWSSRPEALPVASDEIHVWAAPLNLPSKELDAYAAALSPDEAAQAERFKFEKHRNRFAAGRGMLREILGRYLQAKPAALRFDCSRNGKPTLTGEFAGRGIHFNLSHSEDLALIAVTRIGPVGIDIEFVREIKDMDGLVARFFSRRENELFRKVPSGEKPRAFFNLWTRKEALLKATGEGITRSLSLVEVSFLPGEPARLLAVSGDGAKAARWSLRDLRPAPGFVGAVAVQAKDVRIRSGRWAEAVTV